MSCFHHLQLQMEKVFRIAIFASGSGTNAEVLIKHFSNSSLARVAVIFTNRKDAFVIQRAIKLGVPSVVFDKSGFYETDEVFLKLKELNIDLIVLAGFLWLVPDQLISAFPNRIINIHPALLPDFGGKGMYGARVHEAVIASGRTESGISIHLIDHEYDKGKILFQGRCKVFANDTAESLAQRIHQLEHQYFPEVIEEYLKTLV